MAKKIRTTITFDKNGVLKITIPPYVKGSKREHKKAMKVINFLENHPMNAANKKS